jgi:excisionase family DNA binding protein
VKRTVTVDEAAAILKVCRRTIYYMIQRGQLHFVAATPASRTNRIDVDELTRQKKANKEGG